jgi:hypothetical protein
MFGECLTLREISDRTRIPRERLRYVLDQRLLPGQSRRMTDYGSRGRGRLRHLLRYEAFGAACAALMIGAGLRRKTVQNVMALVCTPTSGKLRDYATSPLQQAFAQRETSVLEIGDLLNVRVRGSEDYRRRVLDTGWRQPGTGATLVDYEPLVVVSINLAKLRACLQA